MKVKELVLSILLGTQAASQTLLADTTADQIESLKQQIVQLNAKVIALEHQAAATQTQPAPAASAGSRLEQLDQQIRVLERKRELDLEAAAEQAKQTPRISVGAGGLNVSSADTNFVFALHGVLQTDNRTFFDDGGIAGNDGFQLRRARPILQGTVFRDFDFLFVPDFGNSAVQIFDACLNYRCRPELQLRAGKFKSPVGLEQLQADRDILFNERSLATDLVPNRDLGFQLWGDLTGGAFSYALGVFNGAGDLRNSGNSDFEDHREFAGRVFFQPFRTCSSDVLRGLGFGVAGSFGDVSPNGNGLPATTGGSLPGYTTDGQQQFFAYNPDKLGTNTPVVVADGLHWRLSPQAWYYCGPFGLLAEYVISNQRVTRTVAAPFTSASLEHTAWNVTASWVLTGEAATYADVSLRYPFDPRAGHWGAFQLIARYAALDIDDAAFPTFASATSSASAADAWSVGFNWYLSRNVRLGTSYSRTTFTGGGGSGTTAPAIVTRQPEQVLFTRLQLAF
jgi:phosphate-selective porin OprO and OprP